MPVMQQPNYLWVNKSFVSLIHSQQASQQPYIHVGLHVDHDYSQWRTLKSVYARNVL